MIPTRSEIQNKINEIRNSPNFSSLKSEIYEKICDWLHDLNCSPEVKEKILDDLGSYEHY